MASDELSIGSRLDWINRFIELANHVNHNIKEACGLNITQARILFYVGTHEARPMGNVAAALFLKPSTTTASSNRLFDKGYVSRSYDELDRRAVYLNITQKGIDLIPTFIPAVRKAFTEDLPPVRGERRGELTQLLLPASSRAFFSTDEEDAASIASRIAADLKLDAGQDEVIEHITRVRVIESISFFLSKMNEFDSSLDLAPHEARMLRVLGNDNSGMRLNELSAILNILPNVASLSIRTLTDRKLVNRVPDRKDRRAANVTLSKKGARLVHGTRDEVCEIFDAAYPRLTDFEVSEFFEE